LRPLARIPNQPVRNSPHGYASGPLPPDHRPKGSTMTTDDDKPSRELTTQQRATAGRSKRNGVSGRLKEALDLMVWQGMDWDKAAVKAGLTTRSMRLAMNRPHVLAYLRRERGVRLVSGSTKNLARLEELRDQDNNITGAVQAARTIETITSEAVGGPRTIGISGGPRAGYVIDLSDDGPSPGVVIVIEPPRAPEQPQSAGVTIDVTPTSGSDNRGSGRGDD
jgi:hypothetical protein